MSGDPSTRLAFTEELLTRPRVSGLDVEATLEHFAIVSYAVPPERVRPHVHSAFELDCFAGPQGEPLVWVSMVPFEDQNFRFVAARWLKFRFGQTNYRTYVIDRATGRRGVWFFGTTLDSWSVAIPRYVWKLPWHRGRIRFDCEYDSTAQRYGRYQMTTRGGWAPVDLTLEDTGGAGLIAVWLRRSGGGARGADASAGRSLLPARRTIGDVQHLARPTAVYLGPRVGRAD